MEAADGDLAHKSWPDLVGLNAKEAKKKILEERPDLVVHILWVDGHVVTCDYDLKRVRIFANKDGKVARIPMPG